MTAPQVGHLAFLPAKSSRIFNFLPQVQVMITVFPHVLRGYISFG